MAKKIIPCGGWHIDDSTLAVENGMLTVKAKPNIGVMNGQLDMNSHHIVNATSISGLPETHQVTIEDELNMNNHRVTGIAFPEEPQDAVSLEYLEGVFATGDAVPDCTGDTIQDVKNTLNALLASLRAVGIIAM